MDFLSYIKNKYLISTLIIWIAISRGIPLFYPVLLLPIICSISAILIILYNFFIVKTLLTARRPAVRALLTMMFVIPIFYGLVYSTLYKINPDLFNIAWKEHLNFGDFIYFSIATFATVGYGDIVVKTTSLRMLTSLEIMNGIVILIVAVSNLDYIKKVWFDNN